LETAFEEGEIIRVWDNLDQTKSCFFLRTEEDSVEWNMVEARNAQWSDKKIEKSVMEKSEVPYACMNMENTDRLIRLNNSNLGGVHIKLGDAGGANAQVVTEKDHINPSHYQGYVDDMQWLEVMVKLPRFKNPEVFKGAVELQIRKYLDRNGKKDAELQELQKALFYMKYLVAYITNGGVPILIKDVEGILNATAKNKTSRA
jgi:hypothetical protein